MTRPNFRFLVFILANAMFGTLSWAQDVIPEGRSDFQMEGLQVSVRVPEGLSQEKKGSLILLLHGAGGQGRVLMTNLDAWHAEGYVVCAPQAKGRVWSKADLVACEQIGLNLLAKLPIDPKRVHVMGFSNGAWNLPFLAFSEKLKPVSAVYVGAGYLSGARGKWAVKSHSVLAVAGEQDPNARAALSTPKKLEKSVLRAEAKLQPNLGHRWTRQLNPYMLWWMGVQEGRYRYGQSLVFDWASNLEVAQERVKEQKKGGILVYVYDSRIKEEKEAAKRIEFDVFFDPLVRFYVDQIAAVEIDLSMKPAPFKKELKSPCVVLLNKKGELKKVLGAKVKAKQLRLALKGYVSQKKRP